MTFLGTVVQFATAVGLGGVIVGLVTRSGDRRRARGDVRNALIDTHRRSWVHKLGTDEALTFQDACRDLVSYALIAGVPRGLVERYAQAAQVHHTVSSEKADDARLEKGVALGDMEVTGYLERAYGIFADYLWHPVLERRRLGRRLKQLDAERDRIKKQPMDEGYGRFLGFKHHPT